MYDNYYELSPKIKEFLAREKPESVLEISGRAKRYGAIFTEVLGSSGKKQRLDRISLNDPGEVPQGLYANVYDSGVFGNLDSLGAYDVIFVADLLENIELEAACNIISELLTKTNKAIIAITPVYPYDLSDEQGETESKIRRYHPVAFRHFDFSYYLCSTAEGPWQFYSFYPPRQYQPLDIDSVVISDHHDRTEKLRIAYVLPHRNLTGGMKSLLEQMRQLTSRGHRVYAYLKSDDGGRVLPEWSDLDPKTDIAGQVLVPKDKPLCDAISDVDVIMVGWMTQLPELRKSKVPVMLWEQGYEALYGDYGSLLHSGHPTLATLRDIYRIPACVVAVSDIVADVLRSKYGRQAQILPNGIDTSFYYPSPDRRSGNTILLVGNPRLAFKGFADAISALEKAYMMGGRFRVKWICQTKPDISQTGFPIDFLVMPSQAELAQAYRDADILLSTSLYESFPLPPLEAMASGVAVVATDCGGIHAYASEGNNILLADQGDIDSLAAAIMYLLDNPGARQAMARAGRATALGYDVGKIVQCVEDCFYSVVNWHRAHMGVA